MNSSELFGRQFAQIKDHSAAFLDYLQRTVYRMDALEFPADDALRVEAEKAVAAVGAFAESMRRMEASAPVDLGPKLDRRHRSPF